MASQNVNTHLTSDQHRMLDIYTAQYRQTTDHINQLYRYLDDIRNNINMIMFSNNSNTNSNANYNRNRNRRTTRENDNIFYDYNNPINRDIYLERLAGYQNFGHRIRNTNANANTNTNTNTNANTNSNIYGTSDITADISGLLSSFLNSNVIVRPTNQQIENASRLVSYNEIRNPNSEACPISLERFNPLDQVRQINHCGHIFLPSEFNEWFQSNVRCPVCRYDIRNNQANIINTASVTGPTGVTRDTGVSEIGPSGPCGYSRSEAVQGVTAGVAQGVTAGVAQGALGAPGTISNENISNVNVVRNPQTNIVDQVSFDISGNTITNNIVNTLTNRLFETLFNPSGASNNASDYFVYDPSNNILMYETIFPPSNNDNNNSSNTRPHR